jgi:flagellar motility protein MotE (MotC chaperone)
MADETRQAPAAGAAGGRPAKRARPAKAGIPAKTGDFMPGVRKTRRRRKRTKLLVILIAAVLVAAAAVLAVIAVQLNWADSRTKLIEAANRLDPEYAALEARLEAIGARETAADAREAEIAAEEQRLEEWSRRLQERETELDSAETGSVPIYRAPLSPQEVADMESLGKIYAAMSAARAAEILAELYANEDMAAILYYMTEKSASPILAAMDSRLAAEITEILLERWSVKIT